MVGWISVHRKLQDWEWYKRSEMVHIFIHLLINANHVDNKWQGIDIKRGQLITGLFSISEKTGISIQTIRTCLTRLKSTGEITTKSTNKYSVITICNYDSYQILNDETNKQINKQFNKQLTNNQQTINKQLTTNNNDNNDNNEKNKYISFISLFNSISNRNFSGCEKSKRQFKARIKEGYTLDTFKTAIENLYSDQYHKDKAFQYATPEFITRSDKLEVFLNKQKEAPLELPFKKYDNEHN